MQGSSFIRNEKNNINNTKSDSSNTNKIIDFDTLEEINSKGKLNQTSSSFKADASNKGGGGVSLKA